MKKFILMALVLGVYSMPLSASDVDSDYSTSPEYTIGSECNLASKQEMMDQAVDPAAVNASNLNAHSQQYNEDTPWIGATHKYEFDEFGYDEE